MPYPLSVQWFINLYLVSKQMKCQEMKEFELFFFLKFNYTACQLICFWVTRIINDRKYYIRSAKLEPIISDNAEKQFSVWRCFIWSYYQYVLKHKKLTTVKFQEVSNDLRSYSLNRFIILIEKRRIVRLLLPFRGKSRCWGFFCFLWSLDLVFKPPHCHTIHQLAAYCERKPPSFSTMLLIL